jgi:hypothetical protein
VISYAALSLPSLAAGLAAPSWGLETTGYLYVGFVGALSLGAALHAGRPRAHRPTGDPIAPGMSTARQDKLYASFDDGGASRQNHRITSPVHQRFRIRKP